jgi:hypothetical protein
MTTQRAELRCRCAKVRGHVLNAAPHTVNRMVCYCDDCQAFAHAIERPDLLDVHGGTEVVQVAPAALLFTEGHAHIACLRLSPRGLYRWYARCCNTPLGNTLKPALPFVGIMVQTFDPGAEGPGVDHLFGPVIGSVQGKFALGEAPPGSTKLNLPLIARALGKVLGWKFGGSWPHPFFERETGAPRYPVTVLDRERREALRALCGPRPA